MADLNALVKLSRYDPLKKLKLSIKKRASDTRELSTVDIELQKGHESNGKVSNNIIRNF